MVFDIETGALDWGISLGADPCVAASEGGIITKSSNGDEGDVVQILDPSDGSKMTETNTTLGACHTAVPAGELTLLHSGENVFGYALEGESIMFETTIPSLVGTPVVSEGVDCE